MSFGVAGIAPASPPRSRRQRWSGTRSPIGSPTGPFAGSPAGGSSRRDAYYDCIRRVDVKLRPFGRTFDVDAIVRDSTAPASGERARIEADWHSQP
jgi:hypothetical protein